ncbi:MAG: RDD family protein [Phycisphaeraceae bacterium]|nr:RDD family protein [Phycisphaeraceae bacterium]
MRQKDLSAWGEAWRTARWWVVGCVLAVVMGGGPAWGQVFRLAGDERDLWIVVEQADGSSVRVLHRGLEDGGNRVRSAGVLNGNLLPGGAASGGGRVWLVFTNRAVMGVRVGEGANGQVGYERFVGPPLPEGVSLRSLVANERGPWALVRVDDPGVLAEIDGEGGRGVEDAWRFDPVLKMPVAATQRSGGAGATTRPTTAAADEHEQDEESGGRLREDRLLRLGAGGWRKAELPRGWSARARAWMVMLEAGDDWPTLLSAEVGGAKGEMVRSYRHEAGREGWMVSEHPVAEAWQLRALAVEGQLMVGRRVTSEATGLDVDLWVVRGGNLLSIGRMENAESPSAATWGLAPFGGQAVLVSGGREEALYWTGMDLRGRVTIPAARLVEVEAQPFGRSPGVVVMVGLAVVMTVLAFMLLGRDQQAAELGAGLVLAEYTTRLLAGLVDLAPCLVAGMVAFERWDLAALVSEWPGRGTSWSSMAPGGIAMGLFIVHTMVGEMIWGRSLGKWMLGLRVVEADGSRPAWWQVATRGGLKVLDLLLPPLLVLMVISPLRQRLGDLAGKTVVIQEGKEGEGEGGEEHTGAKEEDDADGRA